VPLGGLEPNANLNSLSLEQLLHQFFLQDELDDQQNFFRCEVCKGSGNS